MEKSNGKCVGFNTHIYEASVTRQPKALLSKKIFHYLNMLHFYNNIAIMPWRWYVCCLRDNVSAFKAG